MESGINGRAIDFARFGQLFLAEGDWNGRRIISERWVTESTAPGPADARGWRSDPEWKAAGGYYKYMWWGMPAPGGGYAYTARGHLGQRIAVFPRDGVVIVRFGLDDGGVDWDEVIRGLAAKVR
jgi:CubicO group peptidase (beta-lactamase class C family)